LDKNEQRIVLKIKVEIFKLSLFLLFLPGSLKQDLNNLSFCHVLQIRIYVTKIHNLLLNIILRNIFILHL
jgi:hypothetical protein